MHSAHPAALESRDQFLGVWREMVLDADPDADVRDLPGITLRWADNGFPWWRTIVLGETGADAGLLAFRLHEAVEIMRAKPGPGFLWLFEDLLAPDARDALPGAVRDAGLELVMTVTGQAGDILPVPDPVHPDLAFERVTTHDQLRAYADLNARAHGLPLDDVRDGLCGSLPLWSSRIHAWLGCVDGVPVTAAATITCDDRLLVLLVATDPDHERRGYGEAVTRKALHEGGRATGLTRATLHATPAGGPVYPRIGFAPTASILLFGLAS